MFEPRESELEFSGRKLAYSIVGGVLILALAFKIATQLAAGETWAFIAAAALLTAAILLDSRQARQRTRVLCQMAEELGFESRGTILPTGFPLHATQSSEARGIRRVFVHSQECKEVLFFDCSLGAGRSRFNRTVVALRGDRTGFGYENFGPGRVTEEVDGWAATFGNRRYLEPDEIRGLVNAALADNNDTR